MDERATWCLQCRALVHAGAMPMLDVAACYRCTRPAGEGRRSPLLGLLVVAALLVLMNWCVGGGVNLPAGR